MEDRGFSVRRLESASGVANPTIMKARKDEGMALMSHNHINGVPALVVNNQYKTDLQMAKDISNLLQILDFLVAKAKENPPKS